MTEIHKSSVIFERFKNFEVFYLKESILNYKKAPTFRKLSKIIGIWDFSQLCFPNVKQVSRYSLDQNLVNYNKQQIFNTFQK